MAAPSGTPLPPPPRLATLADLLVLSLGSAIDVPNDLAALLQSAADFGLCDISVDSFTGERRFMCLVMRAECDGSEAEVGGNVAVGAMSLERERLAEVGGCNI